MKGMEYCRQTWSHLCCHPPLLLSLPPGLEGTALLHQLLLQFLSSYVYPSCLPPAFAVCRIKSLELAVPSTPWGLLSIKIILMWKCLVGCELLVKCYVLSFFNTSNSLYKQLQYCLCVCELHKFIFTNVFLFLSAGLWYLRMLMCITRTVLAPPWVLSQCFLNVWHLSFR